MYFPLILERSIRAGTLLILLTLSGPYNKEADEERHRVASSRATKGVHCVVLWMDWDKEGENINFEVLDVMKWADEAHMHKVFRAKFSAINEKDIMHAYHFLSAPMNSRRWQWTHGRSSI